MTVRRDSGWTWPFAARHRDEVRGRAGRAVGIPDVELDIRPGLVPRAQVVDEFVKRQQALERLITDAANIDWRHVRMRSPVLPIIRMNLGDAFTVLVTHADDTPHRSND